MSTSTVRWKAPWDLWRERWFVSCVINFPSSNLQELISMSFSESTQRLDTLPYSNTNTFSDITHCTLMFMFWTIGRRRRSPGTAIRTKFRFRIHDSDCQCLILQRASPTPPAIFIAHTPLIPSAVSCDIIVMWTILRSRCPLFMKGDLRISRRRNKSVSLTHKFYLSFDPTCLREHPWDLNVCIVKLVFVIYYQHSGCKDQEKVENVG